MRRSMILVVLAAPPLLAGCAPGLENADGIQTARPERQCFSPEQVRNFRQGSQPGQVYVRALGSEVFELNAAGGCPDLDFANRLAIVADGPGLAGGRVCTGDPARIAVPGSTSALTACRVRVTRVLTPEETAALPSRQRP